MHRAKKLLFPQLERANKPGTAEVGAISNAQQIAKFGEKIDNAIQEMKTLYPNFNFVNVTSEL